MRQVRYISLGGGQPANPIVRFLAFVAALGVFAVSVLVGGIVLAALVGFVLLALVVIYVRVWWISRQLNAARRSAESARSGETVEAEYRVIDISDSDQPRP